MAQKLLNAGVLFRDHVYTEIAGMCDVGDVLQLMSYIMTTVVKSISINIRLELKK